MSENSSQQITTSENPLQIVLRKVFGFDSFRPNQEKIVCALLNHQDILAIMPTGGGKSLCFQLPALILEGTCVVVSPLLSLMKDQVDSACELGIRAETLNSISSRDDFIRISRQLEDRSLDLLYISPERFNTPNFFPWLKQGKITFFAIDEAHCISQWGHNFRPDYLALQKIKTEMPGVPVAAFTATATCSVSKDISAQLGLHDPFTIRASFDRPNLYYEVKYKNDLEKQLLDFLTSMHGGSGIVYCGTRKKVEETAAMLCKNGYNARPYHAGMSDEDRMKIQDQFASDEVPIITATVAFGMGIDKSNVRFVVHTDLPKNIESYYQETGRAGRDGAPSRCLLLFSYQDIQLIRSFIDGYPSEQQKKIGNQQLNEMLRYAETDQCRRKTLLAYFGEKYQEKNCGNCDFCCDGIIRTDATINSQKILSAIQRTGNRFGAKHVISVVLGEETPKILEYHHEKLPTFGVGKDEKPAYWRFLINTLVLKGHVEFDPNCQYPVLRVTESGWRVMRGQEKVELIEQPKISDKKKKKKSNDSNSQRELILSDENSENRLLFEKLRFKRFTLAKEKSVPPYVIFTDKTLLDMVLLKPVTREEMLMVEGVSERKIEVYGDIFIDEIEEFLESRKNNPQ